jgi:transposase
LFAGSWPFPRRPQNVWRVLASTGAPQAIQIADRFHVCKNLSEAVQRLLARVLSEMRAASQETGKEVKTQEETPVPVEEWRPDPGAQVARTIAVRRAERDAHYQRVNLREQGFSIKEIACRLGVNARTVRHWFERKVAPDVRPRRKRQSDFDPYAP